MGQSTDAILFWGYCWQEEKASPWAPDEEDDSEGDSEGADDRYARLMGIQRPSKPFPKDTDKSPKAEATRAEFTAYWAAKRMAWEAVGMEVSSHCSSECAMPYVAVKESHTKAWRGDPKPITSLEVGADWAERLDKFCTLMGITPPEGQNPQWWLVSDWN